MAIEGLDVAQVQQLGTQLKGQASQIDQVISTINSLIQHSQSIWVGQDAREFQSWWESTHRPALTEASRAIDGLGQSALNNASEQQQVSGR